MIKRTPLVGRVAFHGVDDDHGVQVIEHSRFPHRGSAASGVQLSVALGILVLARGVFSEDIGRRPAGEAARALIGGEFSDHIGQTAPPRWNGYGGTDRNAHGPGR